MITIEKKIEIEKMKYLVVEGGGGRGCGGALCSRG